VQQRQDSFTKVRLADGKEGWVIDSYLKKDKPATAELDTALANLQKEQETSQKLAADLSKLEREVQVRRDELSNANTTIKDLQKKLQEDNKAAPAAAVDNEALNKANATIQDLQKQLAQLESEKAEIQNRPTETEPTDIAKIESENKNLQARIEAALANLKGDSVPTPEELAAIRPHFPFWYWLLLIALFLGGIAAGIGWLDYRNRQKHGGFRL
jgi:predicted  nucleic acid-binding Zn-ribbon protein